MENKDERPKYFKPLQHSMTRRRTENDYRQGHRAYMITLTVEEDARILSHLSGTPQQPVVRLTELGTALQEAWLALPSIYGHISVREGEYVIMPEHFHGILYTTQRSEEHLSDVLRTFKARVYGSYRRLLINGLVAPVGLAREWMEKYNALTKPQQDNMRAWIMLAEQRASQGAAYDIGKPPVSMGLRGQHNKTGFLFRVGYTDTWALDEMKLSEKRLYIQNNPSMRLLSQQNPEKMRLVRSALTIDKLTRAFVRQYLSQPEVARGYLQTMSQQEGDECLNEVCAALLTDKGDFVVCDSYGNRDLLTHYLLPVVCHRADKAMFAIQKQRCLEEASKGAVLVSPRIAKGEQEIMDTAVSAGYPVILISDKGYEDKQHPGARQRLLCASGHLLIVIPWHSEYGRKLNPLYCKTMNAVALSLCHKKDNWWK